MSLVYPESGARSFAYNRDLSRFVDRTISDMVTETAVPKSALLDVLWKNKEQFTGDRVEWAIYKGENGNLAGQSVFFNIFNATSDAHTATEPDSYLVCSVDPRNAGRKIKLSKIKLAQASGKEAKISYIKTATRARVIELMQGLDRACFTGSPTATNRSAFSGLDYTIDNGGTYSTYAGLTRSNSRALIGNELSATATSIAVTSDTATVLAGRAAITVTGATASTATNGSVVEITDDSGNVRWYFASSSNTNIITLANVYEGATDTSVSIRYYSPFTDLNQFGNSGELTLAKVHKTYSFACDGQETPNLGVCHNFVWSRLRQLVLDTEYSISKSDLNRLGTSGFDNYMVLDMPITVAGNAPTNKLYMVNTNHLQLKTLKGFGSMNLTQDGLMPLATTTGSYATLLGEVVVSGEICSTGNNCHAVLKNITI